MISAGYFTFSSLAGLRSVWLKQYGIAAAGLTSL
jgi:hypothetical protein